MELEHSFTVPVPEDRAWNVLLDVERVAPCMPGATLDSVDGDVIHGKIKVKVGPISMTYAGTARFTERDADAHLITLEASGKETRGAGTASAKVRSTLESQGEQTHVVVHTSLNVTGKPAQFGRGVMNEVGGKLIGIFAGNLADMLSAEAPAARPGPEPSAPEPSAAPAGHSGKGGAAGGGGQPEGGGSDLGLPIDELDLPQRAYNSLRREGVLTVGDLVSRTPQQLLAIENIGPASVEEIRHKLASRGLALDESAASANGAAHAAASAPVAPASAPRSATPAAGERPAAATAGPAGGDRPATAATAGAGVGYEAAAESASVPPAWQPDDDAIDLLGVAGLPVLKRAVPVLAGLIVAALVALGIRRRRRNR
jgi:carbon monoxide dehydrogenase subunit G